MLAEDPPVGSLDRPGVGAKICRLKNSWNGRSPMKQMPVLSGLSNTGRPAACAMRRTSLLCRSPRGNRVFASAPAGDAVQKIALILCRVARLEQFRAAAGMDDPRVVAGGDPCGAQALHVIQANAEFDFSIAQHIRIRRAAGRVFAQEMS